MVIFDNILPMLIGRRDRKKCADSFESLQKMGNTYRNQIAAKFKAKEQKIARRKLCSLKKKIAPVEIDHERFLKAIENKKREIAIQVGISDEDRYQLMEEAINATVYTLESEGKKMILDIDKIEKQKRDICTQANKIIGRQNDYSERLLKIYCYRLSNYLRALNQGESAEEIHFALDVTPEVLQTWNYKNHISSSLEQ